MIEILQVLAMKCDFINTQIVTTHNSMSAKLNIAAVFFRSSSKLITTGILGLWH